MNTISILLEVVVAKEPLTPVKPVTSEEDEPTNILNFEPLSPVIASPLTKMELSPIVTVPPDAVAVPERAAFGEVKRPGSAPVVSIEDVVEDTALHPVNTDADSIKIAKKARIAFLFIYLHHLSEVNSI